MFRRLLACSLAGSVAMTTSSCAAAHAPVATFHHDFRGGDTLHAYAAEPAAERRQGDRVSERLFGLRTESPRTTYICVWRDTGRGRAMARSGQPEEVFLVCMFGSADWTPPPTLAEEAAARAGRDEAVLRARWIRTGSQWRLARLEVEIKQADPADRFRSVHFDGELAEVALRETQIAFPASPADPVRFRIAA